MAITSTWEVSGFSNSVIKLLSSNLAVALRGPPKAPKSASVLVLPSGINWNAYSSFLGPSEKIENILWDYNLNAGFMKNVANWILKYYF